MKTKFLRKEKGADIFLKKYNAVAYRMDGFTTANPVSPQFIAERHALVRNGVAEGDIFGVEH